MLLLTSLMILLGALVANLRLATVIATRNEPLVRELQSLTS
jgi:hypothetical protein